MQILNVEKLKDNINEIARYDLENHKIFGSGYMVMQQGKVVYKHYFGYASTNQKELDDRTIFRLASMTKPMSAIATLILVERGMLALEDEVSKFIPEYQNVRITKVENGELVDYGPAKTPITIRHLLTHTSGIGSLEIKKFDFLTVEDKKTASNLSRRYAQMGVDFEPTSREAYSGVAAFSVLGRIMEQMIGENLQDFYAKEIFEPCGMQDTTFIPTQDQWARVIDMHTCDQDGNNGVKPMREGCIFEDYPCRHCLPGAGLVSTLTDYAKFATMLLNKGKTLTGRIVSENIFNEMSKPQVKIDTTVSWGLGVRVIADGHPFLSKGSFGWSGAYGSHFWVDPNNEIVAVYMKNSTVDGGSGNESARNFESAVNRALL